MGHKLPELQPRQLLDILTIAAYVLVMGNEIRVGGSGPKRTQFASHLRPVPQFTLDPPLGDFVDGGPEDLSPVAIERIYAINSRLGRLPEMCAGDGYVSLDYERWVLDNEGVHLFMRVEDGAILRANVGDGGDLRDTPDHPQVSWLLQEYGTPEGEEKPLNYYL